MRRSRPHPQSTVRPLRLAFASFVFFSSTIVFNSPTSMAMVAPGALGSTTSAGSTTSPGSSTSAGSTTSPGITTDAEKAAPKPWLTPKQLLAHLEPLKASPLTADWAVETERVIKAACHGKYSRTDRLRLLTQLQQQADSADELKQQIWASKYDDQTRRAAANELQRFRYRLSRRMAVWSAALQLPVLHSLGDQAKPSTGNKTFGQLDVNWQHYLLVDEFKAAFNVAQADPSLQKKTARRILARLYSPILKPSQAAYLRNSVDPDLVDILRQHASDPVDSSDLAKRIELYEAKPSARSGYLLNDRYQDLIWSDNPLDQQTADAIDTHYRNANFRLTISQSFMNRLVPSLPTIAEPVSETVQGAKISGRSQVSNEIKVALVPDPSKLNFQIQTNGHVSSDTVARTKAFRIMNQGQAHFQVYKLISINKNGIDASKKVHSTSSANQVLVGIQSKLDNVPLFGHIARKAAEKRVNEQAPATNRMFRHKVASSAEVRVEEELAKQISKVQSAANENLFQPLVAMDLEPTPLQLATTDSEIVIRYRLAGRDQMAANTARPASDSNSLIQFQLHHSLLNNAIARLGLNGETFTGEELAAHLQEIFNFDAIPQDDSDEDRYTEFKFAKLDPIQIQFRNGHVNIILNLDSLKIGKDSRALRKLSLTTSYGVSAQGMMVHLQQDDTGTRIKGNRLRLGERAQLSGALKMIFNQSYSFNAMPEKFRNNPQSQSLAVSSLVLSDGWLGVAFNDFRTAAADSIDDAESTARFGNIRRLFERR